MNNLKKLLVIVLALVMLLSFAACQPKEEEMSTDTELTTVEGNSGEVSETVEQTEITIILAAGDETRKAINDKIITGLETEFPNVVFEIEQALDATDKIQTMNATGDLPDVFFMDSKDVIVSLVNAGSVVDLRPYIEADGFADNYKIKTVIAPHSDGGIYNLQSGADAYFAATLFYNKELFAMYDVEVPVTFDEFVAACEVFKQNGIIPITSNLTNAWGANNVILPSLIAAEDPAVIEKIVNLETDFPSDAAVLAAVEKLSTLANNGYFIEGALNTDYGTSQALFTNGEAAMYGMFSWAAGDLTDAKYGIMSWPQSNPDVNMDEVVTLWGSKYSGYMVSKNSVDVDISVKVAEYCAMTEALYFNQESKMPTSLNTGYVIEDVPAIVQESLDRINNADITLPAYMLYSFSSKGGTKLSELMSEVIIGAETAQGFSERFSADWAENVEALSEK